MKIQHISKSHDLLPDIYNQRKTMGATNGVGTANPPGAPKSSPCLLVRFVLLNL